MWTHHNPIFHLCGYLKNPSYVKQKFYLLDLINKIVHAFKQVMFPDELHYAVCNPV